ncbi:MAG: hypothetical protein ABEJ28_12410 [Salinigranum sp.]
MNRSDISGPVLGGVLALGSGIVLLPTLAVAASPDVSRAELLMLLNPGFVLVAVFLLVLRYWDRIDGADARGERGGVPSQPTEWCADVRALLDDVKETVETADPPVEDGVRRDLGPTTARLQRFLRKAPERLDDDLVHRLYAFEVRCRDLAMGTGRLTAFESDANDLEWIDAQYHALKARLDASIERAA